MLSRKLSKRNIDGVPTVVSLSSTSTMKSTGSVVSTNAMCLGRQQVSNNVIRNGGVRPVTVTQGSVATGCNTIQPRNNKQLFETSQDQDEFVLAFVPTCSQKHLDSQGFTSKQRRKASKIEKGRQGSINPTTTVDEKESSFASQLQDLIDNRPDYPIQRINTPNSRPIKRKNKRKRKKTESNCESDMSRTSASTSSVSMCDPEGTTPPPPTIPSPVVLASSCRKQNSFVPDVNETDPFDRSSDDLSDSFLVKCTQKIEEELSEKNEGCTSNQLNDSKSSQTSSLSKCSTLSSSSLFSSTPLSSASTSKSIIFPTPTSTSSATKKTGRLDFCTDFKDVSTSESPIALPHGRTVYCATPTKPDSNTETNGEFDDDGYDDIFSQIPDGDAADLGNSEKTTILYDTDWDGELPSDFLRELHNKCDEDEKLSQESHKENGITKRLRTSKLHDASDHFTMKTRSSNKSFQDKKSLICETPKSTRRSIRGLLRK